MLNVNKKEVSTEQHDRRFLGDVDMLKECHFMGATTNNPKSKAVKLYSPHLPFGHIDEQWMRIYRNSGFCGKESGVYLIQEKYLDEAMVLAKNQ